MSKTTMRSFVSSQLKRLAPSLFWKRKVKYYQSHFSEMEMYLLPLLCDQSKRSLDIGGAIGVYTANLFDKSADVITFEPIPKNVSWINDMIKYTNMNAQVMQIALSDHAGAAELKMLNDDTGLSTLEAENDLSKSAKSVNTITVEVKRLDDLNLNDIGFIKIDVEGHEAAVLSGARQTIVACKPKLLVEIEERHKKGAVQQCVSYLEGMGYYCYFILNKKIIPFAAFDIQKHQDVNHLGNSEDNFKRKGVYINNFIFVHQSSDSSFVSEAQAALDRL
jgi:FkbM family methyltransferase